MKIKRVSEFLTEDEISAILRVPDRRTLQGKRDYAILLLMFSTGLRKAEACSLKVEHVATYRNQPVVDVIGKGEKHWRVALNRDVMEAVLDYQKALKQRFTAEGAKDAEEGSEGKPLFFTLGEHGNYEVQPLTHKAVDCLLKLLVKAVLVLLNYVL